MNILIWIISAMFAVISAETWHNKANLKKSYFVSNYGMDWISAKSECEQRNSKLAVIVNENQNNYIHLITRDTYHWLGLRRGILQCTCVDVSNAVCEACRKSFVWVDDTPMNYILPWSSVDKHPWNVDGRDCGMMSKDFPVWISVNCGSERGYVCQYDCEPSSCHIANCSFRANSYHCDCEDGYAGTQCDHDINECASNPCQNDGTCVDSINSYRCTCVDGFTGLHCETNIDDCPPLSECMNNGTCKDGINKYECECARGFAGPNCASEINGCEADPCENGGSCIDLLNAFICNCTGNYHGYTCEKENSIGENTNQALLYPLLVGILLFILVLIIVAFGIYIGRRRANPPAQNERETTEITQNTGLDNPQYETLHFQ